GKMQRAPKWMQDAKLEWLFRLMKQPSRFGRMLALPKFVFAVRDEKSKKK
ncbi:MAG: WecB/TagA/CpsF family glycosyltransferase, partial [Acidaminococcaceae bacterium]|nr:WecB/TagA/CpsF family glycosyltransferase [Acidaminococcaceae bacterium]